MASVLNRSTRQYLASVNTPDYPLAQWIRDPDLSAVAGFGSQYWIITVDVVTLMNQLARDVVDAAALQAQRDSVATELDMTEDVLRAFMLTVLDEFNAHALKINAVLDAVDAAISLADLKTRVALIADYPARTAQQLKATVRGKLGS